MLLPDAVGTLRAPGPAERTIRNGWPQPIEHVWDECTECGKRLHPQEYAACPVEVETEDGREDCGGMLRRVYEGDRDAVVESFCGIATHKVWVWWPDLWRRHHLDTVPEARKCCVAGATLTRPDTPLVPVQILLARPTAA